MMNESDYHPEDVVSHLNSATLTSQDVSSVQLSKAQLSDLTRPLLIASNYLDERDLSLLKKAIEFSISAHQGQFRKSGEPYVTHPVAVATLCAERHLDVESLCSALLHDVLEDTGTTALQLEQAFGRTITTLVEGLSKLNKTEGLSKQAAQAINLSKMLHAMKQDVRVILIKLADRLHNMRTLFVMSADKRYRIGRETLDVYAPMAHRLGLFEMYRELEDLSFQHCYPRRFNVLMRAVKTLGITQEGNLRKAALAFETALRHANINASVAHRIKHLWSLYRKMRDRHIPLNEVEDVFGIRVLVQTEAECYLALGVLHKAYLPYPNFFKDYIARPKSNGYQSLHTVLMGPNQLRLEVQIRTEHMHRIAEDGVAAHWLYKDNGALSMAQRLADPWLNKLLEIESLQSDPKEYIDLIKTDLFPDVIYVHTPKGESKALPRGATVIDFAYSVHSYLGNHCIAAKINREMSALRTPLNNGDVIEIITADHAMPNSTWLSFVKTSRAKLHIRQTLRRLQHQDLTRAGLQRLEYAAKQIGIDLSTIASNQWDKLLSRLSLKTREALFLEVGQGQILPMLAVQQLLSNATQVVPNDKLPTLTIQGTEGSSVELSSCCTPIPNDIIIGHIRKNAGLVIHREDCQQAAKLKLAHPKFQAQRWLELNWHPNIPNNITYACALHICLKDEKGALAQLINHVSSHGFNISDIQAEERINKQVELKIVLQVHHTQEIDLILRYLRHQSWVVFAKRLLAQADTNSNIVI